MSFRPRANRANDELDISGIAYHVAEHPAAPGLPYSQEGRQAVVYQLVAGSDLRALKVFKPRCRFPGLASLADRFAGAILLAEMLGWCDACMRESAWGQNYFDPREMQQDSVRFRVLSTALRNHRSDVVDSLLERAWHLHMFRDCATFGEWRVSLPEAVPLVLESPLPQGSEAREVSAELAPEGLVAEQEEIPGKKTVPPVIPPIWTLPPTKDLAATATAAAQQTAVAEATATPTSSATPTGTPTPTASTTPTGTMTPTPTLEPAPVLKSSPAGASLSGDTITFRWRWHRELKADEHCDVRVWREGQPNWGIAWTEQPWYEVRRMGGGKYYWSIAVLRQTSTKPDRTKQWEAVSEESQERWFNYSPPGGSGSSRMRYPVGDINRDCMVNQGDSDVIKASWCPECICSSENDIPETGPQRRLQGELT